MRLWWGALRNEWLKFRRRRRLALGVVVLLGITVT